MKTIRIILFAAVVMTSALAVADWTAQNEKACDISTAGQFKYYTLSLSWSPEFCRSHPGNKEPQCKLQLAVLSLSFTLLALPIQVPKPIQYWYKCIKNKTKDILL